MTWLLSVTGSLPSIDEDEFIRQQQRLRVAFPCHRPATPQVLLPQLQLRGRRAPAVEDAIELLHATGNVLEPCHLRPADDAAGTLQHEGVVHEEEGLRGDGGRVA